MQAGSRSPNTELNPSAPKYHRRDAPPPAPPGGTDPDANADSGDSGWCETYGLWGGQCGNQTLQCDLPVGNWFVSKFIIRGRVLFYPQWARQKPSETPKFPLGEMAGASRKLRIGQFNLRFDFISNCRGHGALPARPREK